MPRTSCYTDVVEKRNVTITLDEDTARWARLEAARRDTSVSRLVGELLREHMRSEERYEAAMHAYLARGGDEAPSSPVALSRTRRAPRPCRSSLTRTSSSTPATPASRRSSRRPGPGSNTSGGPGPAA